MQLRSAVRYLASSDPAQFKSIKESFESRQAALLVFLRLGVLRQQSEHFAVTSPSPQQTLFMLFQRFELAQPSAGTRRISTTTWRPDRTTATG
jgi:hypothetical protein